MCVVACFVCRCLSLVVARCRVLLFAFVYRCLLFVLFVVGCGCSLCVVGRCLKRLLVVFLLVVVCLMSCVDCCSLFVVCELWFVVCWLIAVCCILNAIRCPLCVIYCCLQCVV